MFYSDLYKRTFSVGEDKHYIETHLTERDAVERWKQEYEERGWSAIGRWNSKGVVPIAYVLPKSKDLQKGRPIVPYSNHVLRSVYKVAGRALSYFLSHDVKKSHDARTSLDSVKRNSQTVPGIETQTDTARTPPNTVEGGGPLPYLEGSGTATSKLGFNITRTDEFVKTVKYSLEQATLRYGDGLRW